MAKPKKTTVTPIVHHRKWIEKRPGGTRTSAGEWSPRRTEQKLQTKGYPDVPYGGGDLPKMKMPGPPRGAGTAKVVKAAGKAAGKAATAASKGTMAGKAASWVKRQGFVPSYK